MFIVSNLLQLTCSIQTLLSCKVKLCFVFSPLKYAGKCFDTILISINKGLYSRPTIIPAVAQRFSRSLLINTNPYAYLVGLKSRRRSSERSCVTIPKAFLY